VVGDERRLDLGVLVAAPLSGARILVTEGDRVRCEVRCDLRPGQPWQRRDLIMTGERAEALALRLFDADGREVLAHRPSAAAPGPRRRAVATEPPAPAETASTDQLFLIGEHLEQYRHPTREPAAYWQEALRRDPGDARCHVALGRQHLRRGEFAVAAEHFAAAIARLTASHPNPVTGEAHYHLGLVRRWQDRGEEAYALLAKAAWNYEWRAAAHYELAALDCRQENFARALAHLESALDTNRQNNKAHVLKAAILRRLGRSAESRRVLDALLALDPLDHWARHEEAIGAGDFARFLALSRNDAQTALDLAFDYADAGLHAEALALLERHLAAPLTPVAVPNPLGRSPLVRYALAWLLSRQGAPDAAIAAALEAARAEEPDHFFPSRLHEQQVLEWAVARAGADPLAWYGLGNTFYDRRRHDGAIAAWEKAVAAGAAFATVHRNLGLAYWNVRRDGAGARAAYLRALALDSADARLVYEFDQLRKKLNEPLAERLAFLETHRSLVLRRDDAAVELAALLNLNGRAAEALALLLGRRFHPWEGGEGAVLRQYTTARLLLGREELAAGGTERATAALAHFDAAMQPPPNLGEAYHLLQAKADVEYWLGCAQRALGREAEAAQHFARSAAESGDFAAMAVAAHSPLSYHRGLALRALGREVEARRLFEELHLFGTERIGQPATIDYFATSLPNLLVFEDELQARRDAENHLLVALAAHGLGRAAEAAEHLARTLAFSRADAHAADLAQVLAAAG
jgi:tetratricopeptide (TPR) repeat protein